MPAITASAPGKIILFGEHAVVYNRPAIAVPVTQVHAKVSITPDIDQPAGQVMIVARGIGLKSRLEDLPTDHPLAIAIHGVAAMLGIARFPALRLQISSTIPIASGLGSGAAVSVALARALSAFLDHPLEDDQVSHIAYTVDQKYHGTPSGIDNTVIAYTQPVFFIRGKPFERLCTTHPFTVVIGDTGIHSPTTNAVGDVREHWQADPAVYERYFDVMGDIAWQARRAMENGRVTELGPLMDQNHALLQQIDVSSPELDALVIAARSAGAGGAKLCGGGRGGNMIALVEPELASAVADGLLHAGAVNTIITTISS